MKAVLDEVERRLADSEIDALDARVVRDIVRNQVHGILERGGLSLSEYRVLSGIEEGSGLKMMGKTLSAAEVEFLQDEFMKDLMKKPIIPLEIKPPVENTFRWSRPVSEQVLPYTGMMAIAETEITTGDPYRTPGKQTIENALIQAGIHHEILIKVRISTHNPEHLEKDQRDLLDRIASSHNNITFLYELDEPISLVVCPPRPPSLFSRIWTSICVRFGMAAAGIKAK
jgi:hypothetical protein